MKNYYITICGQDEFCTAQNKKEATNFFLNKIKSLKRSEIGRHPRVSKVKSI